MNPLEWDEDTICHEDELSRNLIFMLKNMAKRSYLRSTCWHNPWLTCLPGGRLLKGDVLACDSFSIVLTQFGLDFNVRCDRDKTVLSNFWTVVPVAFINPVFCTGLTSVQWNIKWLLKRCKLNIVTHFSWLGQVRSISQEHFRMVIFRSHVFKSSIKPAEQEAVRMKTFPGSVLGLRMEEHGNSYFQTQRPFPCPRIHNWNKH